MAYTYTYHRPVRPSPSAPWRPAPQPVPRFAPGHSGYAPPSNNYDPQSPYQGQRGPGFHLARPLNAVPYGTGRKLRGSRFKG